MITVDRTFASTSVTTGTTGSLSISVPSTHNKMLVVAVASNYTSFGANISSLKFGFKSLPSFVSSVGVEIRFLLDPIHTPGITTKNIDIVLNASQSFAMAAYLISERYVDGFAFGAAGLDAGTTGNPQFSGAFNPNAQDIIIDCVRINSNTILPNGSQVSVLNLNSGGVSYGSSYYQSPDGSPVNIGWTRQGTPVDASWGLVARLALTSVNGSARIVTS